MPSTSPTTTLRTLTPTHSNSILTETEVANANEKNVPDRDPNAQDRAGKLEQTDRGSEHSEHTTEDGESGPDVFWVDWEGPEDPANPKKCVAVYPELISKTEWSFSWSYRRKWAVTIVVSLFTFIAPVSSSMVAPAIEQIAHEFGITNTAIIALTTSVFILGFGKSKPYEKTDLYQLKLKIFTQLSDHWYISVSPMC